MKLSKKNVLIGGILVAMVLSVMIPSIKADAPSSFTNENADGSPRRIDYLNMYLSDPHGEHSLTVSATSENWSQYTDYNDFCRIAYVGTIFSPANLLSFEMYFDSLQNYYGTYGFSVDNIEICFWQWMFIETSFDESIFALTIFNFFTGQHEFLYANVYDVPYYFKDVGEWHFYTGNKTNLADPTLEHYLDGYGRVKITALYYIDAAFVWLLWPIFGIYNSEFRVEMDEITVKTTWIPR